MADKRADHSLNHRLNGEDLWRQQAGMVEPPGHAAHFTVVVTLISGLGAGIRDQLEPGSTAVALRRSGRQRPARRMIAIGGAALHGRIRPFASAVDQVFGHRAGRLSGRRGPDGPDNARSADERPQVR
jgi:hypothetical protein